MWRNIVISFERVLVLKPPIKPQPYNWNNYITKAATGQQQQQHHRSLCSSLVHYKTETQPSSSVEGDPEYIVPYKPEYERAQSSQALIEALRTRFRLSDKEMQQIMEDPLVAKHYRKKSLLLTLDLLMAEGVTRKQFVEYPWIITLEKGSLTEKISLLKSLRGFRDINDFVPFLRLHLPRLRRLVGSMNQEADHIAFGSRIYYIADKLKAPVSLVNKYLAKRLFVLEMPLEMFKTNLELMLKYNVESHNILKDLWAFRYAPRSVEMRLKRAISAKKDKIMPWMVRCPESILQKSLQISLDDLEILGDRTPAEYVGDRLGFTAEQAMCIMNKHPQVKSVRMTKIKEVLDYLLNEAKFTRHEIAQVPRILCHSLETTKQRMEELKQYGCRPSSLVILCKSKREYSKFLNAWIDQYNPNKNRQEGSETKTDDSSQS
ncbi:transcription termination factor, mitochondrial [Musca vetustissima]|uniref:transcription termination factor, mitochondrial n=1 Tax=Musca vetustissima TaxID=27455 RepID=UPI002AB72574|nr:transcription termination factor, mitochondrial [Musca vetustissima]